MNTFESIRCAGGAGGSIYILSEDVFSGGAQAVLTANGGSGSSSTSTGGFVGCGGGGGRISIQASSLSFSGSVSAFGGSGSYAGGAGTIFFKNSTHPNG